MTAFNEDGAESGPVQLGGDRAHLFDRGGNLVLGKLRRLGEIGRHQRRQRREMIDQRRGEIFRGECVAAGGARHRIEHDISRLMDRKPLCHVSILAIVPNMPILTAAI